MTNLTAAQNIDNFSAIAPIVNKIDEVHCNNHVKPKYYPIVGKHSIKAMKEILQDGATDEAIESWTKNYCVLAKVFIQNEQKIYSSK